MGTAEMMIVFSALMALIALVTIGIDWIGKPLKHRRFIPRIYRFDDEKLPVDEYGNTTFVTELDEQQPPLLAMYQPGPQPMASPQAQHHPMAQPLASAMLPTQSTEAERTVAIAAQPSPRPVATIDSDVAASATASRSAFTDSLAVPKAAQPTFFVPIRDSFAGRPFFQNQVSHITGNSKSGLTDESTDHFDT